MYKVIVVFPDQVCVPYESIDSAVVAENGTLLLTSGRSSFGFAKGFWSHFECYEEVD